jgi:hypothetical protein
VRSRFDARTGSSETLLLRYALSTLGAEVLSKTSSALNKKVDRQHATRPDSVPRSNPLLGEVRSRFDARTGSSESLLLRYALSTLGAEVLTKTSSALNKKAERRTNGARTAHERRTNGARTAHERRTNGARTAHERRVAQRLSFCSTLYLP